MTAPDAAELMKLADKLIRNPNGYNEDSVTIARALKQILSAPTEGEVAEIEKRHTEAEDDIKGNFGAAYSSRITQDSYGIHTDRATLLRYIKSRALQP